MKSKTRIIPLAAALVLAPAAFFAQDAAAQVQAVASPRIGALSVNADAGVTPGSTLRFQLTAPPDARRAEVVLGSSGIAVPLRESAPGSYTGRYVVRRVDRLDPSQLLAARVNVNGEVVARNFSYPSSFRSLAMNTPVTPPAMEGVRGWDRNRPAARDDQFPRITDLTPSNGDRVSDRGRTHIAARLSDEGRGIDPASVRLRVAGRDVTNEARITADAVDYRADLPPGRYTAEVYVRDLAGNSDRKTWSFDVAPDHDRAAAAGGLPLQVASQSNAIDRAGNVTLEGRTVPYASVHVQVDAVPDTSGLPREITPVLDETIQADPEGHFVVPVQARGSLMPGQRYDVRMTASSGGQTGEQRFVLRRG